MKPKVRGLLHDHIDGSAVVATVISKLYQMAKRDFPFPSVEAWLAYYQNPQTDLVKKFDTVTSVLQSVEALDLMGYLYGLRRAIEGYAYVEAKFAPQYHQRGGLSIAQASTAMIGGLRAAERQHGIRILPQLCIGRDADPDVGIQVARVALDYDGEVALDLACTEAGNPPEKHLPAYKMTFGSKVKRTCHAGEWVEPEPRETYRQRLLENVRTAVYVLKCDGIGHAIPLADDPALVAHVVNYGIRVEGCPAAYVASGLIKDVRELRIGHLLDQGVRYTLNEDDDLFLPPMDKVIEVCDKAYRFTRKQAKLLEQNVFLGAFGWDGPAPT